MRKEARSPHSFTPSFNDRRRMRILGISAFYHDSAAALVRDGEIVAAAQEERFTRKKHDSRFPSNAVEYCLSQEGVGLSDIDFVAFYDKPFLKFERLLETYVAFAPRGLRSFAMAMPLWVREKLFQKNLLHNELKQFSKEFDWEHRLLFAEHHQSHAASAFYPSPFEDALILTMDGVGRMGHDFRRARQRQQIGDHQGNSFSAFARPPLFSLHLLHRLQGQLGRVQSNGPCAIRLAAIRKADSGPAH